MATRNLYLIRHGEYHWSEENPELNEHLTDKGREQARIVGKALAERLPWIDKIYTSNMHRAQETTEEILTMIPPVKVLRCSMLRECFPCLYKLIHKKEEISKGISQDEIRSLLWKDPEFRTELNARCKTELGYAPDDRGAQKSFNRFFRPTRGKDRHEIIVAHGNLIRYLCCRVLNVLPDAWAGFGTNNCGITVVKVFKSSSKCLWSYNDIGHLPESMIT